jgi:endoglucanase
MIKAHSTISALFLLVCMVVVLVTGRAHLETRKARNSNDPFRQNARLGRGVNLGNALEAPQEGAWGLVLEEVYFQLIAIAGFDAVRIPICWSCHAAPTPPYTIDPNFFARVDWAVEQALSRGLLTIVNMHHYNELFQNPSQQNERYLALWAQIAERYKGHPPELLFELLNEPHDALTAHRWNELLVEVLGVVRETNPDRNVILGPAQWNSLSALSRLELPEDDRHIIVTFHYYDPFPFTHQGAEWADNSDAWLGTTWQGSPDEKQAITRDFDLAAAWAEKSKRPLFLGEFGAYSRADIDSRARWTDFVARAAEERGMSWAYWEFGAGFGVFDRSLGQWNVPILHALIPPED